MNFISAEKAREQSSSFNLTQEEVIAEIGGLIDANSKAGKRSVVVKYMASVISREDVDAVLVIVRGHGYDAEFVDDDSDREQFFVRISW